MSNLQRKLQARGLPPMAAPPTGLLCGKRAVGRKKDYSPLSWDTCFDTQNFVSTDAGTFCVYTKGTQGPLLVCLHGGGFSSLSWALFTRYVVDSVHCQVLAFDQRGHGQTETRDDTDLSIGTLSADVGIVLSKVYENSDIPPVILIGHSMGGAVAVHASQHSITPSLIGLIVVDVVEGSAMEALSGMKSVLRSRPPMFKSVEHAIEWSIRSGQIKNLESARLSMSGQVKQTSSGGRNAVVNTSDMGTADSIAEEEEAETPSQAQTSPIRTNSSSSTNHQSVEWRINLEKTECFWPGWFEKLSSRFLEVPVPKILLLAGVDRLDKDLAIGQMQGKFQMQVIGNVGHTVQEDAPDKVADVVATFIVRHKFAEPGENFSRVFPAC